MHLDILCGTQYNVLYKCLERVICMDCEEMSNGILQETRRGIIVLCVLSQLKTPKYGYNLSAELTECGLNIEFNTLYPLLRRLNEQGLLESWWDTSEKKPKKYYCITEFGKEVFQCSVSKWKRMMADVNRVLEVGDYD